MFANAKLAVAAGLTGIVLAVVGVLWYLYSDEKKDNETLTKVNASQGVALSVTTKTAENQAKTAEITDKVVAQVVIDTKTDQARQQKIDDFVAEKVDLINRKYPVLEKTTPTPEAATQAASDRERDEEISRIRITGLWQTYCDVVPTDPQCKTN